MIDLFILFFKTFKNGPQNQSHSTEKIGYMQLMGISWSLHLIYAFYSVFALFLGVKTYNYFSGTPDFTHFLLDSFNFKFQKVTLLTTLFSVILYPFIFRFSYQFWKKSFKFYAIIFNCSDDQLEINSDLILTSAYTSNIFLIFPLFGNFLSNISMAFFIFMGLKSKLKFSSLQAFLVLITPLFILFLISVFTASYFIFLFTLI
jgi:hypothetical protein